MSCFDMNLVLFSGWVFSIVIFMPFIVFSRNLCKVFNFSGAVFVWGFYVFSGHMFPCVVILCVVYVICCFMYFIFLCVLKFWCLGLFYVFCLDIVYFVDMCMPSGCFYILWILYVVLMMYILWICVCSWVLIYLCNFYVCSNSFMLSLVLFHFIFSSLYFM